jgi:hypothetical protein
VSKLKGALELDLAPDLAVAACHETFRELDWEMLVDEGAVIAAREDATRLSCRRWPATTKLRIARGEHGGAVISIETEVPGFGPISSSHARDRHLAVVRRIAHR